MIRREEIMFMLSVLAGAFISLGVIFATTVSAGSMVVTTTDGATAFSTALPYGVVRLLSGNSMDGHYQFLQYCNA